MGVIRDQGPDGNTTEQMASLFARHEQIDASVTEELNYFIGPVQDRAAAESPHGPLGGRAAGTTMRETMTGEGTPPEWFVRGTGQDRREEGTPDRSDNWSYVGSVYGHRQSPTEWRRQMENQMQHHTTVNALPMTSGANDGWRPPYEWQQ